VDQTAGAALVNSGFLISLWIAQRFVGGELLPLRYLRFKLEVEL
jgi:hypothetical protein